MATVSPVKDQPRWPFEYKGWRVTFVCFNMDPSNLEPWIKETIVEHLHDDPKQLVRWTKRQRVNKKTWERLPVEEDLCCFICAEYMGKEIWHYFEKCKEMTKCSMS